MYLSPWLLLQISIILKQLSHISQLFIVYREKLHQNMLLQEYLFLFGG